MSGFKGVQPLPEKKEVQGVTNLEGRTQNP